MKKVNYHTHTYRCGHANGNEEEMIQAAINMGIEDLGMCGHVPLPHYRKHLIYSIPSVRGIRSLAGLVKAFIKNGPSMRMPYKQLEDHLDILRNCQKKYEDQINIYKGFEAEGLEEYYDYYQTLLYEHKVDYLILGHHFHKHCIHSHYYGKEKMTKKDIYLYCNEVEKALETQLFSYLAHPDLFLIGYSDFDLDAQTVTRRICEKAKELNIPLEINAGGMRRGLRKRNHEDIYLYPNTHFWKIASEVGNDVILGFDAHDPSDFNDAMYQQMMKFAQDHELNVIDHFEFLQGNFEKYQAEYDIR
ncbi:histidinol-phosphatase [Candidatus Stoquefichus sp. SB1]|uniref:histidinol-phosphatase n=1 Tax=Candidatus Stoquefichus sp. SB1 TaxID=1658109 RepID=UPI00067EB6AB|nr:histidinol-phosphatase [Candidatus Stoquefichus sp. SB1]